MRSTCGRELAAIGRPANRWAKDWRQQMIGDLLFQVVGEFVGYGTGRVLVAIFTPHIRVARTVTPPWQDPKKRRNFLSLTFVRDGQRYYLNETVTAIGVVFWLIAASAFFFVASRAESS
jgi:hypothetical protein